MKKNDEGYVLILVVVVMIVMSLVSASILTFSLRNLQSQQASIQRMQDKYAAQGEMEKQIEELVAGGKFSPGGSIELADNALKVPLTATYGSATVTCVVQINSSQSIVTETIDGVEYYKITDMTWEYAAYDITYSTGGGAGE